MWEALVGEGPHSLAVGLGIRLFGNVPRLPEDLPGLEVCANFVSFKLPVLFFGSFHQSKNRRSSNRCCPSSSRRVICLR